MNKMLPETKVCPKTVARTDCNEDPFAKPTECILIFHEPFGKRYGACGNGSFSGSFI